MDEHTKEPWACEYMGSDESDICGANGVSIICGSTGYMSDADAIETLTQERDAAQAELAKLREQKPVATAEEDRIVEHINLAPGTDLYAEPKPAKEK